MILAGVATGSAGPIGLLIVLLIGLALVLLVRNMNGRLRRLPRSFDAPRQDPPVDPPAAPSP